MCKHLRAPRAFSLTRTRSRYADESSPMKVQLPIRQAILDRRTYEPPAEGRAKKLRLDFNENTSGCSPSVIRALSKLSPKQLAMYPEYQRPTERLARHFGVKPEELLLANGGDDALRVVAAIGERSEEHTSELQSPCNLVCRLLL